MPKVGGALAKLTPIPAMESADRAADQIREAIVTGSLKPGERLVEKQLTDQLGISRHPVREALRILSREGFVEMRLNRGAVVTSLRAESILEVYEIRSALGEIALRHLLGPGGGISSKDLKHLKKLANNAILYSQRDSQEDSVRNDLEFQYAIIEAANLPRTARYFLELTAEVQRFNNVLKIVYSDREGDARNYVMALFMAISEGALERAQKIWTAKFATAVERYLALLPQLES
ncbi:GntR family transcriptional regulator [Labrys monachus]|uniref:DNA-binding GntR family transcriptional regulator n=1 Tax=Labrys monachus TaxID=217067 RepID=A0ABU0FLI7_9HYPH|nr:GntR family transcriptional regulator [Labrys monachus]MDQ0394905.1 DNA-binding GntR family transcriptional regulator [Labrys monachus]